MRIVMDKKKDNLYQVACLKLFELSHKGGIADNVGNHPNAYVNSSLAYKKELEKKDANAKRAAAANSSGDTNVQVAAESMTKEWED